MYHLCSPLRYPGGKNCIFPFVSRFFHENGLIGISYAEPYAGGAGLALRLLFEEYVDRIYINDLDRSIYAFWKTILYRSDDFSRWLVNVDVSIKTWRHCKEICERPSDANLYELAKATFFLNRTNVSGVLKGGVIGGYDQKGKYKLDVRFNKIELIERIKKIARFKNRIILSNDDGLTFLKGINQKKEDIFIYLDPPYLQKGADLYMNYYSKRDHQNLSAYVKKVKKRWMVSYDNQEFILSLYTGKRALIHKLSQSASNRVGDEILIFSDGIQFNDSMAELKSPKLLSV